MLLKQIRLSQKRLCSIICKGGYFALYCDSPQIGKIDDKIAWRFQQRRRQSCNTKGCRFSRLKHISKITVKPTWISHRFNKSISNVCLYSKASSRWHLGLAKFSTHSYISNYFNRCYLLHWYLFCAGTRRSID